MHGDGNLIVAISQEASEVYDGESQGSVLGNDKIIDIPNLFLIFIIDVCSPEF